MGAIVGMILLSVVALLHHEIKSKPCNFSHNSIGWMAICPEGADSREAFKRLVEQAAKVCGQDNLQDVEVFSDKEQGKGISGYAVGCVKAP